MKKIALLTFVSLFVGAMAFGAIVGSRHDLRSYGGACTGGNGTQCTTQVCVYCHTPHNANTDTRTKYLWNRNVNAGNYTVYDGTYTTPLASSTAHTLQCMSCHDGVTTAIGQMLNPPSDYTGQQDTVYVTGAVNLGSDLTNDHPIDLVYLTTNEGGPLPASTYNDSTTISPLQLFSLSGSTNVLTCATCHEPHNTTAFASFLRVTPDNSQICTTCHNL